MSMRAGFTFLVIAMTLSGCSTVKSRIAMTTNKDGYRGLAYRLPRQSLDVKITFIPEKPPELEIKDGNAYSDASPVFLARIPRSGVGKVNTTVTIGQNGLLTSSSASYTSQFDVFLKKLAKYDASNSTAVAIPSQIETGPYAGCPTAGVITVSLLLAKSPTEAAGGAIAPGNSLEHVNFKDVATAGNCTKLKVAFVRLGWTSDETKQMFQQTKKGETHSNPSVEMPGGIRGFYYRINQPYLVIVEFGNQGLQYLAMLPDESNTYYVQLPRSVFANSSNSLTFKDGTLVSQTQATDGELLAAFNLPADFVRAYASAVGDIFANFKTARSNEESYDTQEIKLELLKIKIEACKAAIAQKDEAGKKEYCTSN